MAKLGFDFKAENLHLFGIYIVKSIKRGKARGKVAVFKNIAMFYYQLLIFDTQSSWNKKKEIEKCFFCHLTVGGFNNIVICK